MADLIVEIDRQAPPLPLLGQGQGGGQRTEVFLVGGHLVFRDFAHPDLLVEEVDNQEEKGKAGKGAAGEHPEDDPGLLLLSSPLGVQEFLFLILQLFQGLPEPVL